jgi:hypothetical protein
MPGNRPLCRYRPPRYRSTTPTTTHRGYRPAAPDIADWIPRRCARHLARLPHRTRRARTRRATAPLCRHHPPDYVPRAEAPPTVVVHRPHRSPSTGFGSAAPNTATATAQPGTAHRYLGTAHGPTRHRCTGPTGQPRPRQPPSSATFAGIGATAHWATTPHRPPGAAAPPTGCRDAAPPTCPSGHCPPHRANGHPATRTATRTEHRAPSTVTGHRSPIAPGTDRPAPAHRRRATSPGHRPPATGSPGHRPPGHRPPGHRVTGPAVPCGPNRFSPLAFSADRPSTTPADTAIRGVSASRRRGGAGGGLRSVRTGW